MIRSSYRSDALSINFSNARELDAFLSSPDASRFQTLTLQCMNSVRNIRETVWEKFSNLSRVKILSLLCPSKVNTEQLAKLNLPNLTELDLSRNHIEPSGVENLTHWNLPNLTELMLHGDIIGNQIGKVHITDEGVRHLANGKLSKLMKLDLSDNWIGDEGAEYLANGNLPNLTHLNLRSNKIGGEGTKQLTHWKLPNLTHLDLRSNEIGEAMKAFLRSSMLRNGKMLF